MLGCSAEPPAAAAQLVGAQPDVPAWTDDASLDSGGLDSLAPGADQDVQPQDGIVQDELAADLVQDAASARTDVADPQPDASPSGDAVQDGVAVAPDAVQPDAASADAGGCPASCGDTACAKATCLAGTCEWTALAGSCDDGDPCTVGDTCKSGACLGVNACKLPVLQGAGNSPCQLAGSVPVTSAVTLQPWFVKLLISQPIHLVPFPDDSDRLILVSRTGQVQLLDNKPAVTASKLVLDLKAKVSTQGEGGLLSIAFHPEFKKNRRFYVHYTILGTTQSVVSQFTMLATEPEVADPASEVVIIQVAQPWTNHDGGQLLFDSAGMLLVGFGDGGSAGDPLKAGQDPQNLLGKILRVDINGKDPGKNYAIPKDNPFVGKAGWLPEIYALGLRNPWRFSADRVGGQVWIGDVGQNKYEEIDLLAPGANYGWNIMEATHCYSPASGCVQAGLTLPVVEVPHGQANSITGGYVYRGTQNPGLYGAYIFGDYSTGKLWSTVPNGLGGYSTKELVDTSLAPVSFGEDRDGELYVLQLYPAGIFKVVAADSQPPPGPALPAQLSKTGCFELPAMKPAPGVVPYEVNAPLWSDGAHKRRWLVLPPGASPQPPKGGPIGVPASAYESWDFPVGTLVIKHFALGDQDLPVETRFMRRDKEGWAAFTYRWNTQGTDADLLLGGGDQSWSFVEGGKPVQQTWHVPSLADCVQCHKGPTAAAQILGIQSAQLQRTAVWSGGQSQLALLQAAGFLTGDAQAAQAFVDLGNTANSKPPGADLGDAARAYLHSNCSHCHRPGGKAQQTSMDLRFDTALAKTGTCGALPQSGEAGVAGAKILAPGEPAKSTLYLRLVATAASGWLMPQIGVSISHTAGAKLIADWIKGLGTCPP